MTTFSNVVIVSNMRAQAELLVNRRDPAGENAFVEMVLWRVPQPVRGSRHEYKYRLAYVVEDVCVLRYDNEAGKGDHKHANGAETPIVFSNVDQLLADFMVDLTRWNDENLDS